MTPLDGPNRLAAERAGYGVRMSGTPSSGVLALLGASAALLLIITGCTAGSIELIDEETPAAPTPSASPSAGGTPGRSGGSGGGSVDLSNLPIARGELCELVDADRVEEAIGGPVLQTGHYVNGQDATPAPGLTDVAHEYGCVYQGTSPTEARVWVFARPVGLPEARRLVRGARSAAGCREVDRAGFGDPGVATVCRVDRTSPVFRVRFAGLFGDAWLSCELSRPRGGTDAGAVRRTAARWCTDVAVGLGARP